MDEADRHYELEEERIFKATGGRYDPTYDYSQ
jgi:hypothetical protein